MILLLGDIHGDSTVLQRAINHAVKAEAAALIQIGDFGLMPRNEQYFYDVMEDVTIPVYFIDGNHDDCTRWMNYDTVGKVFGGRNLYHVPRGAVLEIDGRTIAFLGGAASIDKQWRMQDKWHWDEHEEVTREQVDRLIKNAEGKTIDMFLTHCPPTSVIEEHFDPRGKLQFGVSLDWHDPSQTFIEEAWHAIGTPYVYSGHMHRRVIGMTYRILDIDELLAV